LKEPSKLFDILTINNVAINTMIKLANNMGMELAIDEEIPFYKIKYN
jgi:hypothetical protein